MNNPAARRGAQMMQTILASLDGIITRKLYETVFEDIEYSEPGIALELLCSELDEYDTDIPAATWHLISEAGSVMGINPNYWEGLTTFD